MAALLGDQSSLKLSEAYLAGTHLPNTISRHQSHECKVSNRNSVVRTKIAISEFASQKDLRAHRRFSKC
jgi:hypothetical protein